MPAGTALPLLLAICSGLLAGCHESTVIEKVADQAATIAKLEIEREDTERLLAECRQSLEASEKALQSAKGEVERTKSELQSVRADLLTLQKRAAASEELAKTATQEFNNLSRQMEAARRQLAAYEASAREESEKQTIVGRWKLKPGSGSVQWATFTFVADGTGLYSGSDIQNIDKLVSYTSTSTKGAYKLRGTAKRKDVYGKKLPDEQVMGVFTVDQEGQIATLEFWSAVNGGQQIFERAAPAVEP